MPELNDRDRQIAEQRLLALKFEVHALSDQTETPPLILAVRVRNLVSEIRRLQRSLGSRLVVESELFSRVSNAY
jgi:hypothetical protein